MDPPTPARFSDQEKALLRFLNEEFATKGGEPIGLSGEATFHRDVMERFNLDSRSYRLLTARLQTMRVAEPVGLDAANGYLKINSEIVSVVSQIDAEESKMGADEFFRSLVQDQGEDFEVRRADGSLIKARGVRDEERGKDYVGFLPGTSLQVGDSLLGIESKDKLRVTDVGSDLANGKVYAVKAFFESEGAYQLRIQNNQRSSITIQSMTNSAIQQNSPGATQNLRLGQTKQLDAKSLIEAILQIVDRLDIDESSKKDLRADAETAEAQLKKSNPNPSLVRSTLESIQASLSQVVTTSAATATTTLAQGMLDRITEFLSNWVS